MGLPIYYNNYVTKISGYRATIGNDLTDLTSDLYWAGAALVANDVPLAGQRLQNASVHTDELRIHMCTEASNLLYCIYKCFQIINDEWPDVVVPADLTMDAILSTMLSADPYQVMYFIGLLDAYKQSVWNKPFNEEFFAALARGFEQWP